MCIIFLNSLQVQVHQKRAQDPIQGCTEAGDQTQTPVLPGEDDIVSQTLILFQCVTLHMSFLHFLVSLSAFFLSSYSYFTFFFLLNPLTFSYLLTCVPCFSPFPLVIHPLFLPACTLHML